MSSQADREELAGRAARKPSSRVLLAGSIYVLDVRAKRDLFSADDAESTAPNLSATAAADEERATADANSKDRESERIRVLQCALRCVAALVMSLMTNENQKHYR